LGVLHVPLGTCPINRDNRGEETSADAPQSGAAPSRVDDTALAANVAVEYLKK